MRVKEWADGGLILDGGLEEGVKEAYESGRLVEAFALLHGWIDWLMGAVYQLYIDRKEGGREDLGRLIEDNPSWRESLERLSSNNIMNTEELNRLKEFNNVRNRVIHRLVARGYQTRREKITKEEAERGFNEGLRLVELLKAKTEEYAPFRHPSPQGETPSF